MMRISNRIEISTRKLALLSLLAMLQSCAYHAIDPPNVEYQYRSYPREAVDFKYRYGVMEEKGNSEQAAKEQNNGIRVVAFEATNKTDRTLKFGETLFLYSGSERIDPVQSELSSKRLKVFNHYWLISFIPPFELLPVAIGGGGEESEPTISDQTALTLMVGFWAAHVITGITATAYANDANKEMALEFSQYAIADKEFPPGKTVHGIFMINAIDEGPLSLRIGSIPADSFDLQRQMTPLSSDSVDVVYLKTGLAVTGQIISMNPDRDIISRTLNPGAKVLVRTPDGSEVQIDHSNIRRIGRAVTASSGIFTNIRSLDSALNNLDSVAYGTDWSTIDAVYLEDFSVALGKIIDNNNDWIRLRIPDGRKINISRTRISFIEKLRMSSPISDPLGTSEDSLATETIYLKDGWEVSGVITENVFNEFVRIRTKDGKETSILYDRIKSIKRMVSRRDSVLLGIADSAKNEAAALLPDSGKLEMTNAQPDSTVTILWQAGDSVSTKTENTDQFKRPVGPVDLLNKSYLEFGGALGPAIGIGPVFGYWTDRMGLIVSGIYLDKKTYNAQINLGIRLKDNSSVRHSVSLVAGIERFKYEELNDRWRYGGIAYDCYWKHLFIEGCLTYGTGSYKNPKFFWMLGYIYRSIR